MAVWPRDRSRGQTVSVHSARTVGMLANPQLGITLESRPISESIYMEHPLGVPLLFGLGSLGKHLAMRLAVGRSLYVYDDDQQAAESAAHVTGAVAVALANLPGEINAAILCPGSDGSQANQDLVLFSLLRQGTLVIDMRPHDKAGSSALAERAALHGLQYVEAAVSGGTERAVTGELVIAVGGTDDAFAKASHFLEALGTTIVHCGDVGSGRKALELKDLMFAISFAAAHEILRASTGIYLTAMIDLLGSAATSLDTNLRNAPKNRAAEFDSNEALNSLLKQLRAKRTHPHV